MRIQSRMSNLNRTLSWAGLSGAVVVALLTSPAAHAAPDFAPAGAKATLSVDYVYESAGQRSSEGQYDPYQWQVKRTVSVTADLVSKKPTPAGALKPMDDAQRADLTKKAERAQAASTKMAPTMAAMEKISEKCGDDESCLTKEAMKLQSAMTANGQMDAMSKSKGELDEVFKPGAIRYQDWAATGQKGRYAIKEVVHVSVTDPICVSHPRHRCTRDEVRVADGELPNAPGAKRRPQGDTDSWAEAELDAAKNTLTLRLPAPLSVLDCIETITTDEPEGTHEVPTPKGPHKMQLSFRLTESEFGDSGPITVPLKGGWRSQSGEYTLNLPGEFGNGGKLKVVWRFKVQ